MKKPPNKKILVENSNLKKEKLIDEVHTRIFIGFLVFAIGYHYFFEPRTLGQDVRYNIYIVWLPILLGVLLLVSYRRQHLLMTFFSDKKHLGAKFLLSLFYIIQGLLLSWLSVGHLAKISWGIIHRRESLKNEVTIIRCDINKFSTARSSSIDFYFQNKTQRLFVNYSDLSNYAEKNPKEYQIVFEARKGIWNYYSINKWFIVKKGT